jgi:phage gp29-like protein
MRAEGQNFGCTRTVLCGGKGGAGVNPTGLALSRITGRPVPASSALAVQAAAPKADVEVRQPSLGQLIRPQARDRWLSQSVKAFTPQQVENTIRSALSGNLVAQWEMFDLMEATWPRLNKNLNELKVQPWATAGDDPTPEAEKRRDLVEELIWNMQPEADADENDFEATIRDLLDAKGKGTAVLEIDWAPLPITNGTAMAPRATWWIHPRYYGYPPLPRGRDRLMLNLQEIISSQPGDGGVLSPRVELHDEGDGYARFPENKFLIGICKTKSGHPLGGALLRTLGFWWAAANFTAEWFLNFAQVFGMPIRWATYDTAMTPTDKNVLADMLENMGSAAWAMFPAGTAFELKEAVKSGADNPQMLLLNFADKVCDILVLRQTLTTDVGDSGSRALGDVHEGVLDGVKLNLANWAASVFNRQLIRPICLFNYGNLVECPYLAPALKEEKDEKALAERDKVLLDAGAQLPKTWFYERHGIPIPADGEEVIERAAPMATPGFGGAEEEEVAARGTGRMLAVRAKNASDQLAENVIESLTGVQAKWLAGVKPVFARLVRLAQGSDVTDAEFTQALDAARKEFPELFEKLDTEVNGAVRGAMRRKRRAA